MWKQMQEWIAAPWPSETEEQVLVGGAEVCEQVEVLWDGEPGDGLEGGDTGGKTLHHREELLQEQVYLLSQERTAAM